MILKYINLANHSQSHYLADYPAQQGRGRGDNVTIRDLATSPVPMRDGKLGL